VALPDAIVAVITRGDEVLLIRRGATVPDPGVWAPISGKIEPRWVAASEIARIEPAFTVDREFFERVFTALHQEDHR